MLDPIAANEHAFPKGRQAAACRAQSGEGVSHSWWPARPRDRGRAGRLRCQLRDRAGARPSASLARSGCGKSTLARCVARLLKPTSGEIMFEETDLAALDHQQMRPLRARIQFVFQDPHGLAASAYDDARHHCRTAAADRHECAQKRARVAELLSLVKLDPAHADRYPHEFSGGQRQRIGIARALALSPELIILDEPVSGTGRFDPGGRAQSAGRTSRTASASRNLFIGP